MAGTVDKEDPIGCTEMPKHDVQPSQNNNNNDMVGVLSTTET